jgi:hypothetical protein
MSPADMLSNVYQAFLLDFEEQSRHSQAAQAAKNQQQQMQQQQQQQQTQMSGAIDPPSTSGETSVQSQQGLSEAKAGNVKEGQINTPSAILSISASNTLDQQQNSEQKASISTQTEPIQHVKDSQKGIDSKQTTIPRPASRADSVASQVGSTSSIHNSRAEGELLAQRQRMLLQAQTKAMLQGMPASAFPGPYGGSPGPSAAGPSVEKVSLNGSGPNGEVHNKDGQEKQSGGGKDTRCSYQDRLTKSLTCFSSLDLRDQIGEKRKVSCTSSLISIGPGCTDSSLYLSWKTNQKLRWSVRRRQSHYQNEFVTRLNIDRTSG